MEILIWNGTKYNHETYDKTLIQNFKQKYWYWCSRSPQNVLIIDDSKQVFTNYLKMLCNE